MRTQTTKPSEENIKLKLYDIGSGSDLLDMTQEMQAIQEKIDVGFDFN